MRPLAVSHVSIESEPGRPSKATVRFDGGICLCEIQVWPARHGPLVLFPSGRDGSSPLHLTPVVRTMVVRAVVAAWRKSRSTPLERIAA
jgi:hypothetical protein